MMRHTAAAQKVHNTVVSGLVLIIGSIFMLSVLLAEDLLVMSMILVSVIITLGAVIRSVLSRTKRKVSLLCDSKNAY